MVAALDERVGPRHRSAFISETIRRVLEDERRWDDVIAALGGIPDRDHDWDEDPGAWVHAQRRGDERRVG